MHPTTADAPAYYTEDELDRINNETVIYNGKEIGLYDATQKQRQMESSMRDTRVQLKAYSSMKNNSLAQTEFTALSVKLKDQEAKYRDFCKQTGLAQQNERLRVVGFNRSLSQKAVWANKKSIDNTQDNNYNIFVKSLDVDDFTLFAEDKNIKSDVVNTISSIIKNFEAKGNMYISSANFGDFYDKKTEKAALFQVVPNQYNLVEININSRILGGLSVEEINSLLANSEINLPNSLEEAVVHECGHAKLLYRKTINEIQEMYSALEDVHIENVSTTAYRDGAECIAEVEVLLYRGEEVPEDAMKLYNKYLGGDK